MPKLKFENNYILNLFIMLCIFIFPLVFMTVRHGVHIPLFLMLAVSIVYFGRHREHFAINFKQKFVFLAFLAFASLFIATIVSQIGRWDFHPPSYDGPSKLLVAGIVFLYLRQLKLSLIPLLEVAIPLGLVLTLLCLMINPGTYWGGRLVTYFVDPNTLGSQSTILAILAFMSLQFSREKSFYWMIVKLMGVSAGLYISVGAASRGAWAIVPVVVAMAIFFQISQAIQLPLNHRNRKFGQILTSLLFIFLMLISTFLISDVVSVRLTSAFYEIKNWLNGSVIDSAAGIRMSMWKISLQLSQSHLLFGLGDVNIAQRLQDSGLDIRHSKIALDVLISTGPHSDILSKLLSLGVVGLSAYLFLLILPFYIFFINRASKNIAVQQACYTGMYYVVGIFIAGLTNEQLSLKYLCTFYGLMIATLLSQVLHCSPEEPAKKGP